MWCQKQNQGDRVIGGKKREKRPMFEKKNQTFRGKNLQKSGVKKKRAFN